MEINVIELETGGIWVLVEEKYLDDVNKYLVETLEQGASIIEPQALGHGVGVGSPANITMKNTSLIELPYADADFIARKLAEHFHGSLSLGEKMYTVTIDK